MLESIQDKSNKLPRNKERSKLEHIAHISI